VLSCSGQILVKILLLVFKSKNGFAHVYISQLLPSYDPGQGQMPPDDPQLETYGGRSFLVQAARLWNKLGDELRKAKTVGIFRHGLKTHLFRRF
jgi:hypothetical protein